MKKVVIGLIVLVLAGLLVAGGAAAWGYAQLQPVNSSQTTQVSFVVPRGQAVAVIGQRLQDQGLIRNELAFRFTVWREHLSGKIQAGSFMIAPSMSTDEVAQQLTTGTNDVWVTILEGWRSEEIVDSLDEQELPAFDRQQFLALAKGHEGYLFPDSYLVPKSATAEMIYNLLRSTFDKKVTQGLAPQIVASGQSLDQIVTMASIVQREAREFDQMKLVAGILQNRIKQNMGLNVDATLQYAKGYDATLKTWWPEPLAADRELNSPFNTYKFAGLPPHAIANPGLQAIQAVLQPTTTQALYYIHDAQGAIHTAVTLQQQTQNIQKYLK